MRCFVTELAEEQRLRSCTVKRRCINPALQAQQEAPVQSALISRGSESKMSHKVKETFKSFESEPGACDAGASFSTH